MIWKRKLYMIAILSLLLGSWKGYVALYQKGASEPIQIFPCAIASLPLTDQASLESGIPIRNERDLQQVLEDYLS
jgi:hypothetical protein